MATNSKKAILVVDDSQMMRAMIRRIIDMTELPIEAIYEAANGAEALKVLRQSAVTLVMADLNMPVMDGFEMIKAMREDAALHSIPVFVISAQPDPETIERLKAQGVAGYLPKPFTPEAVRDLLTPHLLDIPKAVSVDKSDHASFNLALAEALAQALETMAFISPELLTGLNIPELPKGSKVVRIDFSDSKTKGSLSLAASPELGCAMASNLSFSGSEVGDDALKELANVTCGLLLRMRPGKGVGFHLTPPQVANVPDARPANLFVKEDLIALQADGHLIAAQVKADASFYGG